jgi:hypothetical protein
MIFEIGKTYTERSAIDYDTIVGFGISPCTRGLAAAQLNSDAPSARERYGYLSFPSGTLRRKPAPDEE